MHDVLEGKCLIQPYTYEENLLCVDHYIMITGVQTQSLIQNLPFTFREFLDVYTGSCSFY